MVPGEITDATMKMTDEAADMKMTDEAAARKMTDKAVADMKMTDEAGIMAIGLADMKITTEEGAETVADMKINPDVWFSIFTLECNLKK